MYKLGLLVVLPLALGAMSPGAKYGASSGSNGANTGMNVGPNMNMGSSGTNARMSPNAPNMGPHQPNQPNANPGQIMRPRFKSQGDIPYQCTMYADRGYFCPYGWSRPSRQYFFNSYTGRCEPFFYLGCGGNLNRHSDKEECVRSCACFANSDYGKYPCSERNTIRWYFSQYSGTCHRFRFSGCNEGNDNNFRSDLDCQSACGPKPCDGPWCGHRMMPGYIGGQSNAAAAIGNAGSQGPVNQMPAIQNMPQSAAPMQQAMPNAPQPAGINGMPSPLNLPMNQPNMQGSSGMNMMTNSVPSDMNSGNKGMDMGSITKIWRMASQSMNQDAPSNGMSMAYP